MTVSRSHQRGNATEGGACCRVERPSRGSEDAPAGGLASPAPRGRRRARRSQASWDGRRWTPARASVLSVRQVPRAERLAPASGNAREGCSKTFMKPLLRLVFLEAN